MSEVFDSYARYYDLLNADKNYEAEANYVLEHVQRHIAKPQRILELGCGTAAHAEYFSKAGYSVRGVDMSEAMLARARVRKDKLPPDIGSRLSFSHGDIRTIRLDETFDVVISLFHVMSYQTSNDDLAAAFEAAAVHLRPGGVFLFDFWYGPAVLTERPEVRVRRLDDETVAVTRLAEPVLYPNTNIVDVNYTIFVTQKASGVTDQIEETHRMRYLFLPELKCYHGKFREVGNWGWMTDAQPSDRSWAGMQVLIRK